MAADDLAYHLADPRKPTLCPPCVKGIAHTLCACFIDSFPRLRVECPAVFDACIMNLTLTRTPDDLSRLQREFIASRKACQFHHSADELDQPPAPSHLRSLLEGTSMMFCTAIQLGDHSFAERAVKANKPLADKQGRWPSRVEQLFPDGTRSALDTLLAYCEMYISVAPLATISSMLAVARPAIFPLLCSEPLRARIVGVVLKMLDPVASGISDSAPWLLEDPSAFKTTVQFFRVLLVGPGSLPNDRSVLFAEHEPALVDVLGPIIDRLDENDPQFAAFCVWCADIVHRADLALPPRIRAWLDQRSADLAWLDQRSADLARDRCSARMVYEYARLVMASRACCGPGCQRSSVLSEGGQPFPACARCRVPRYCSRACQRADWTRGAAPEPHKRVCGVLATLGAHECQRLPFAQFEEAYDRAEPLFDDADAAAVAALVSFWINS